MRCVGRALRAAKLERLAAKQIFSAQHDYAIGEVRPLLPRGFLAAWQAAVTDRTSGSARLTALLPATVRPAGAHCLRFYGPDLLWAALEEWLNHASYVPVSGLFDYYARPGDWWISHRTLSHERDFVQEREREEICLDRVDPVVSALRRAGQELWQTVGARVKIYDPKWDVFDATWVIDPAGHVVGDVRVTLPLGPRATDYARQAIPIASAPLQAAVAAIRFGRQRGFRRVAMHYGPDGTVRAVVARYRRCNLGAGMPSKRKVHRRRGSGSCWRGSNAVPWGKLQHAYGAAKDVPGLLRKLLVADPKVRSATMDALYGNVFHQGTRFPAAPYVVPFLIELCASPAVPDRGQLLRYWGSLITGYFSVQERPTWGDGKRIYMDGEIDETEPDPDTTTRTILPCARRCTAFTGNRSRGTGCWSRCSAATMSGCAWGRRGCSRVCRRARRRRCRRCRRASAPSRRAGCGRRSRLRSASWARRCRCVACSPATTSRRRAAWRPASSRASIPAMSCWGRCCTSWPSRSTATRTFPARAASPRATRRFRSRTSLPSCSAGPSRRSAIVSTMRARSIPCRCVRRCCLRRSTSAINSCRSCPSCSGGSSRAWSPPASCGRSGTCRGCSPRTGFPSIAPRCAALAGVAVTDDEALKALRSGLAFADIGFLDKGRDGILAALALDPAVLDRAPAPEESWLLCAKAFAETDAQRALEAFRRARAINPAAARRVDPTWRLADVLARAGETML